jgi:hypothetical protein
MARVEVRNLQNRPWAAAKQSESRALRAFDDRTRPPVLSGRAAAPGSGVRGLLVVTYGE